MSQDALQQDISDRGGDAVDVIVEEWRRERPDLDPVAKEVTGRIVRLASRFQQAYSDTFGPLGLNDGDYGVLAPLRRAGAPFELTPTELVGFWEGTSYGSKFMASLERPRDYTDDLRRRLESASGGRAIPMDFGLELVLARRGTRE